jgi:phage repressor protein C with HTH and peptisase S24 domain
MIGQRIKEARKARQMTRPQLAESAGIPYPTLAEIESGRQKSTTQLTQLCRALAVNPLWLAEGKGPRDIADPDDGWANVLGYAQAASLGEGAEAKEYAETHKLKFRAESLRKKKLKPERLAVVYGRGDSMLPRIRSGDAILFDTGDKEPVDGALYVVTYDRHVMAKRLTQLGGRWFVESLNRDDPKWRKPQPIDEHKGFEIHGRVRWIGSWED